ncbi:MAG TPA: hypothetical protein VFJ82_13215 [Longimicrobium sp.]|nr:hypothetical protein [Longimicrobium sp.]
MHKLKLSLDELSVETFRTEAPEAARGTVNGQMRTINSGCVQDTTRVGNCFCTEGQSCFCQ